MLPYRLQNKGIDPKNENFLYISPKTWYANEFQLFWWTWILSVRLCTTGLKRSRLVSDRKMVQTVVFDETSNFEYLTMDS